MEKIKFVCGSCFTVNAVPADAAGKTVRCGKCGNGLLDPHPVSLNSANFADFIMKNDLPVVVDFWAPWCGPCRMMGPVFESVASDFVLKARFAKLNTEESPQTAMQYGIQGIPTLMVFQNGSMLNRSSGAMDAASLRRWVESVL